MECNSLKSPLVSKTGGLYWNVLLGEKAYAFSSLIHALSFAFSVSSGNVLVYHMESWVTLNREDLIKDLWTLIC